MEDIKLGISLAFQESVSERIARIQEEQKNFSTKNGSLNAKQ